MATSDQIQQIYIGLLGRAADQSGLDYWTAEIEGGVLTLEQLRANIVNEQPEYAAGLGTMTRAQVVAQLYQNLFERAPEDEGLDYWVNGGGASVNVDQLVLALVNGASAADTLVLDNKTEVASYYTEATGENYTAASATAAVADVDASSASVVEAKAAIDSGDLSDGEIFTLTTGIDSETGTAGGDIFNAALSLQDPTNAGSVTQTLTSFDEIDGGEGTDRLNATLDSADADSVVVENVENIYLRSRDNAAAIDMENVSGAEQLWSDRSTNDLTLTNVQNGVTVGLNDVDASTYSVTYAADVLESAAFTQNVVANGAGDSDGDLALNVVAAGGDAITGLNIETSSDNFVALGAGFAGVETLNVAGSGSLALDEQGVTTPVALETVAAGDYEGDLSLTAVNGTLQSTTTGSGDDSITLGGALEDEGFVNTGAGDDEVDSAGNDIEAGASIDLGAGDDTVMFGAGTVDKDASVDGGEGTDTLQLQAVGAANVGAFSNFEVFDVAALNKTLDTNILAADNSVTEIVGSAALGGASELTNLEEGVGFRATSDMGATELTLTQETAGDLAVTLDADQEADAAATANNNATTTVAASNATGIDVVFDSASINEIDGGPITNVQTIALTVGDGANATGGATSINIESGGENAANVLDLTDNTVDANGDSVLTDLTITGDQDLDITSIANTNNSGIAIETVDAGELSGDLTVDLGTLANGAEVTLGSGADTIEVGVNAGAATGDIESIVGFEASTSTTDADLIEDADTIDFANAATVGTGADANVEVEDGVATFLGAGPSTLDEAIDFVNGLDMAQDAAVAFEYVGDTYVFVEGTAQGTVDLTNDSVVKLTGVTDVESLNVNADDNLYIA